MKARKHEDGSMGKDGDQYILQNHENRLTRLEVVIENINTSLTEIKQDIKRLDSKIDSNFKWLLGMMIGGFASVLGIIGHAQHWI